MFNAFFKGLFYFGKLLYARQGCEGFSSFAFFRQKAEAIAEPAAAR